MTYKYKATIKERASGNESSFKSNNLQSLIGDINACHGVSFIIVDKQRNRLMMKGSK